MSSIRSNFLPIISAAGLLVCGGCSAFGDTHRLDSQNSPATQAATSFVTNSSLRLADRLPSDFSKSLPFRYIEGPIALASGGFYVTVEQYSLALPSPGAWPSDSLSDGCGRSFQSCSLKQRFILLFDSAGMGIRSIPLRGVSDPVHRVGTSLLVNGEQLISADGAAIRTFEPVASYCLYATSNEIVDTCGDKRTIDIYNSEGKLIDRLDFKGQPFTFLPETLWDEDGSFVVNVDYKDPMLYRTGKLVSINSQGDKRIGKESFVRWFTDPDSGFLAPQIQMVFEDMNGAITNQFKYSKYFELVRHHGGGVVLSAHETRRGIEKLSASGKSEWYRSEDCYSDSFTTGWTLASTCYQSPDSMNGISHFIDPTGSSTGGSLPGHITSIHAFQDIPEEVIAVSPREAIVYDGRGGSTASVRLGVESMVRLNLQPLTHSRLAFIETDATDDPRGSNNENATLTIRSIGQ